MLLVWVLVMVRSSMLTTRGYEYAEEARTWWLRGAEGGGKQWWV